VKSGDQAGFRDGNATDGQLGTGTNLSSPGSGILDSKGGANSPLSVVKSLVTGSDSPFGPGLSDNVTDAPTLPSGSGPKGKTTGPGDGWSWVPDSGGTGGHLVTDNGGAPPYYPPYNPPTGDPTGGGWKSHKSHSSDSTTDGVPGQPQGGQTDWGPVSDFADTGYPSGLQEQPVPEPGAFLLLGTALVGIVVLRRRSTRTA
jgi:hypothetical protein